MAGLGSIVINTRTGARGTASDFVDEFKLRWARPAELVDQFTELLSPDIKLIAPLGNITVGHERALRSLRRLFEALPDMRGEVDRWSETDDAIFIEMRFIATIGGRRVEWPNVDRFRFEHGVAVERVAHFDPLPLLGAFLRNPKGWAQLRRLRRRS